LLQLGRQGKHHLSSLTSPQRPLLLLLLVVVVVLSAVNESF